MKSSREPVTEDLIDPNGKKLVLLKYPSDFDVTLLHKKKLLLPIATPPSSSTGRNDKKELLKISQDGDAMYVVHSSMDSSAWEMRGLRPLVLNHLTNESMVGDSFSGCISVVRNFASKVEENMDIMISGYNVQHQQINMGKPKLPYGSNSPTSDTNTRKRKVGTKQGHITGDADSDKYGKESKKKMKSEKKGS